MEIKIDTTKGVDYVRQARQMLEALESLMGGEITTTDEVDGVDVEPVTPYPTPEPTTLTEAFDAVSTAEVDNDGLPWDERIHSGSKKLTTKGVWQRRRNVSDEVFNAVVAELTTASDPAPAASDPAPTAPDPNVFTAAPPAPVPNGSVPSDWPTMLNVIMTATREGLYNEAAAQAFLQQHQLPVVAAMGPHPELWPGFLQAMRS